MPLQMPHVSVCDSHSSLPQSKHCVLAARGQAKPTASARFKDFAQFRHKRLVYENGRRQSGREF
jgi:hypothetical protein